MVFKLELSKCQIRIRKTLNQPFQHERKARIEKLLPIIREEIIGKVSPIPPDCQEEKKIYFSGSRGIGPD
jgi:hypothetical protein